MSGGRRGGEKAEEENRPGVLLGLRTEGLRCNIPGEGSQCCVISRSQILRPIRRKLKTIPIIFTIGRFCIVEQNGEFGDCLIKQVLLQKFPQKHVSSSYSTLSSRHCEKLRKIDFNQINVSILLRIVLNLTASGQNILRVLLVLVLLFLNQCSVIRIEN